MKMKSKWILMFSLATMMLASACQPTIAPSIPVNQVQPEVIDDTLYAVRDNGLYGYVNSKGQVVIAPQFEIAYDFSEDLARVEVDGKLAYINRSGNIVLKTDYEAGESFKEGLAVVSKNNTYGYIDKDGKVVVELQYGYTYGFSEGLAAVIKDGRKGYIDKTGKVVLEMDYDYVGSFKGGLARVTIKDKNCYINPKGEIALTVDADIVYDFNEGMAFILKDEKFGVINQNGDIIVKPVYDNFSDYSEGLAAVSSNGKWGYINKKGDMVIPPQFKSASQFKEGLAPVLIEGDWQYINKEGISIINNNFNMAYNFSNGIAIAEIDGEAVLINTKGEVLWHETDSIGIKGEVKELGKIIKKRIRSNKYDMIMAYPTIEIRDKAIEDIINKAVEKHFNIEYKGQPDEAFDGDYDIKLNKNGVLSIVSEVYTYFTGGAHGMTFKGGICFDVNTGKVYKLEELFKKDGNYELKLNEIIRKELSTRGEILLRDFEGIYDEQEYYLTEKGIVIYYQLYDYTPYAYGFLEFEIPYEEIKDIIDKEGPLGKIIN